MQVPGAVVAMGVLVRSLKWFVLGMGYIMNFSGTISSCLTMEYLQVPQRPGFWHLLIDSDSTCSNG